MEEPSLSRAPPRSGVTFLNVARTYIPNTKVECHYTLPPGTVPSTSDWIGIFKVALEPFPAQAGGPGAGWRKVSPGLWACREVGGSCGGVEASG